MPIPVTVVWALSLLMPEGSSRHIELPWCMLQPVKHLQDQPAASWNPCLSMADSMPVPVTVVWMLRHDEALAEEITGVPCCKL